MSARRYLQADASTTEGGFHSRPVSECFAITPDDVTDLAVPVRGLYVGTGGDVVIDDLVGNTVTFVGVPGGAILPIGAKRVRATGTTAANIVGLV